MRNYYFFLILVLFILSSSSCSNVQNYDKLTDVTLCEIGESIKYTDNLRINTKTDMFSLSDTGRQQEFIHTDDYFGYVGQLPIVIATEKNLQNGPLIEWSDLNFHFTLKSKAKVFGDQWVLQARRKLNKTHNQDNYLGSIGTDTVFSTNGIVRELIVFSYYDNEKKVDRYKTCGKNKLNMKNLLLTKL